MRVLLAWIDIDRGHASEAHSLLSTVRAGPAGAVHDFADVAEARAVAHDGHFGAALGLLEPLRGKLVDPGVRGLYSKELVLALVATARFDDAMQAMLDWAEQAAPIEREDVLAEIEGIVRGIPASSLEAAFLKLVEEDRADVGAQRSSRSEARRWLLMSARSRLERVALTERDPELARRLLESSPVELGHDDEREAISALAAESAVAARVAGRALGVVLDVSDDVSRRRSAQVVEGMTRALGLPEAATREDAVRLVTRDASEPGEVERALAALAGDGATILVGGVTGDAAIACSVFAEQKHVPVIVLGDPPATASAAFTFAVGDDPAAVELAVKRALDAAGVHSVARVGPAGVPCDARAATVAASRFPLEEWKRAAIEALVLAGDPECTRDAAQDVASAGLSPLLIVGLESAEGADPLPGRKLLVGAGQFPLAAHALTTDERAWVERFGSGPSWYETLGRDAALLGAAALADFPLAHVEDHAAVATLHARARDALLKARAALWSTASRGFDGNHVLPRDFSTAPPGEAPP